MNYTSLGKTGIRVSVAGLGCGGNSLLGLGRGASRDECADLVRAALDLGVNLLDTAEPYGTEDIVGAAIKGRKRDEVVISTKSRIRRNGELITPAAVVESLEQSLSRLGTESVDVFHLHAIAPADYDFALNEVAPALEKAKAEGKLKHIGITETGPHDPSQQMLSRAIHDRPWEVIMLAFSMMNQAARRTVFPTTQERGIGTLLMFVVRNIFSQPDRLRAELKALADSGTIPKGLSETPEPLDFLIHEGGAATITEAAYRYVRHQPGVDVVLFGTGRREHLSANIAAINKPPLPEAAKEKLHKLFGELTGIGLDLPDRFQSRK